MKLLIIIILFSSILFCQETEINHMGIKVLKGDYIIGDYYENRLNNINIMGDNFFRNFNLKYDLYIDFMPKSADYVLYFLYKEKNKEKLMDKNLNKISFIEAEKFCNKYNGRVARAIELEIGLKYYYLMHGDSFSKNEVLDTNCLGEIFYEYVYCEDDSPCIMTYYYNSRIYLYLRFLFIVSVNRIDKNDPKNVSVRCVYLK